MKPKIPTTSYFFPGPLVGAGEGATENFRVRVGLPRKNYTTSHLKLAALTDITVNLPRKNYNKGYGPNIFLRLNAREIEQKGPIEK